MRIPDLKTLTARLRGKTPFELPYYRESELRRLLNLFAHVDLEAWRGMKILEVGAGLGRIGEVFVRLGFDVTSTDGREEYVERMKAEGRKAFVLDLDKTGVDEAGDFDIVLSFGVLYHLAEPERFLQGCAKAARVLLLESVVRDAFEPSLNPVKEKTGWLGPDQAVSGTGCRPTPSWVEQACRSAGFDSVRDISTSLANWSTGRYDWEVSGTNESRHGAANLRKMWVCTKTLEAS
jgi:SAM-dependent methyltransferase